MNWPNEVIDNARSLAFALTRQNLFNCCPMRFVTKQHGAEDEKMGRDRIRLDSCLSPLKLHWAKRSWHHLKH
jgi:hypothetical protein